MNKRLVLLGAGSAHLGLVQHWRWHRRPAADILWVNSQPAHFDRHLMPHYLNGVYTHAQCQRPLPLLAKRAGVTWMHGTAVALDKTQRQLVLASGERLTYDVLSIATGGGDRDSLPGAREHAVFMDPADAFACGWPALRTRLLNLPIDAGPAVSILGNDMLSLEMAVHLQGLLRQNGRGDVLVQLIADPETWIGSPRFKHRLHTALQALNIILVPLRVTHFAAGHIGLMNPLNPEERSLISSALHLVVTSGQGGSWLKHTGLPLNSASGQLLIDARLQTVADPHIFASGGAADASSFSAGQVLTKVSLRLAHNLQQTLTGGQHWHDCPIAPKHFAWADLSPRQAVMQWRRWQYEGEWVHRLKQWHARWCRQF